MPDTTLLRSLVDNAEGYDIPSCLLCNNLRLVNRGGLVQCRVHECVGRPVDTMTADFAHALRRRAKGCDGYEALP